MTPENQSHKDHQNYFQKVGQCLKIKLVIQQVLPEPYKPITLEPYSPTWVEHRLNAGPQVF